jgi:ketosteroid isomerase-like protein
MSRLSKPLLFATSIECEQAFYEALESGDLGALADLLFDDDAVYCVHPGGPRVNGPHAVRASWAAVLARGALRIRAHARKALETPTVALHSVIEEIVVQQGVEQRVLRVIVTNVYVKTPSGWKLAVHHGSIAPEGGPIDQIEVPVGPLH